MNRKARPRTLFLILLGLIVVTALTAVAATNDVATSRAGANDSGIAISNLVPPQCSGLGITIIYASGSSRGSGTNGLYLGDAAGNSLSGGNGRDCLVGGGGNDTLNGNNREDVLLGGAGNDTLNGGPHTDVCDGGPGTDTCNCETETNCEL
jgi:Ca2+-binding RTX toxin-like protein